MKFYGQYDMDRKLYERYFKDKKNGIALECGAVDGIQISSTYFFEESLDWTCVNIEPNPNSYAKLIVNRPKSININLALSDEEVDTNLVTSTNFYLRSFLTNKTSKNTVPVRTGTYRKIIDTLPIDHIDLMVLDVEGHEISALKGMIGAKILPQVLCIEFNHVGKSAIKDIVEKMGYVYDFTIKINDIYIKI